MYSVIVSVISGRGIGLCVLNAAELGILVGFAVVEYHRNSALQEASEQKCIALC